MALLRCRWVSRPKEATRGQGRKANFDWSGVATVTDLLPDDRTDEMLALDEALSRLEREDPDAARLVRLRFFVDLSIDETAEALEISPRSVDREWAYARARLLQLLRAGGPPAHSDS